MNHDYFGSIEFQDDIATLNSIAMGDREIEVEIDASDRQPNAKELDALALACQSHVAYEQKILHQVRDNYDELLTDALDVWFNDDKDLVRRFNTDAATAAEVTVDHVVQKLVLADIRLEVAQESEVAFDLRFDLGSDFDYLVCGRFDCGGNLTDVGLES